MLKLALVFGNDMVLQREKPVPIWGTAAPGAEVNIQLQGQSISTKTDETGAWMAVFKPLQTSFDETVRISSANEEILLTDVQVGEVWLAGGQSNMEFCMRYDADMKEEVKVCQDDRIRFFDHPKVSYAGELDEVKFEKYGFWRKADADNLERFSAVGYYFAKELERKYQVPIGIIGCNWGGSPACAWMSKEYIQKGQGQVYLDEYQEALRELDMGAYESFFQAHPHHLTDPFADPIGDLLMYGCTFEELGSKLTEMGIEPPKMDGEMPPIGPRYARRPSGLYETMLSQLAPIALRGFIYYQGETDGDTHPECYRTLFPALIHCWRALWKEDLPFLFVQLAPLQQWGGCIGKPYAIIRKAQQETADTVPGTGMAVITDVGMQWDIHPKKKQPVGYRLALLAENKVYGDPVLCEAPTLIDVTVEDGRLILGFANAGEGLVLRDELPYGQTARIDRLNGLRVFQAGVELSAENHTAQAEGQQVVITGAKIKHGLPTQVKLAADDWCLMNLYNSAGIPARPAEITGQ